MHIQSVQECACMCFMQGAACKGQSAGLEVGCQKAQVVMKTVTYSIRMTVHKVVKTLTVLCRTLLSSGSKAPARRVQNGTGVGSI